MTQLLELQPRRPLEAPGEAWFMSKKRKFFTELIELPADQVSRSTLDSFLFEMTSGLSSFEGEPDTQHWVIWYRYLLPYLLKRAHECYAASFLLEAAITAFLRMDASGVGDHNEDWRRIALETLGKVIITPEFWDEHGECICPQRQHWLAWDKATGEFTQIGAVYCSGSISASLFFCLTYLPAEQLNAWTRSLFSIRSVFFRAHVLVWLAGAFELLLHKPFNFGLVESSKFDVTWENSHLLGVMTPSIGRESIHEFLMGVREWLPLEQLTEWMHEISMVQQLADPLSVTDVYGYVADTVLKWSG